jgi:hypothetical protein
MRNRTIGILAATIAAAATLVPAATAGQTFQTEIVIQDGSFLPDDSFWLAGTLESNRDKCESDRVVKLLVRRQENGPLRLADTDRSSTNGLWAASFADADDPFFTVRIRATLKRISPSKTCVAESIPVLF